MRYPLLVIALIIIALSVKGIVASNTSHFESTFQTLNDTVILKTGWYDVLQTPLSVKRTLVKTSQEYIISPRQLVGVEDIKSMEIAFDAISGKPILQFQFTEEGIEKWKKATTWAIGMELGFVINNTLIHVETIDFVITTGRATIDRADLTKEELESFITSINKER